MSWSHAGPSVVDSANDLDSPNGVINSSEWDAFDLQFDAVFPVGQEYDSSWLYFPNDFNTTNHYLRIRFQPSVGNLRLVISGIDPTNGDVTLADLGNSYTLGETVTIRVTRNASRLVEVFVNGSSIGSWTHAAEISLVEGMIHFGHTSDSQMTVSNLTLNTGGGDVTAPTTSSPTGTETGETTASGTVSTDEDNGTLYYWATQNASESAANIRASGASQAVSATGVQNVAVTGLTAETGYYLHYVHVDAADNESNVVSSAQFTTEAAAGGGGSLTAGVYNIGGRLEMIAPTGLLAIIQGSANLAEARTNIDTFMTDNSLDGSTYKFTPEELHALYAFRPNGDYVQ